MSSHNILELEATDARKYFLKGTNYVNFDIPKYFSFDEVLSFVNGFVGNQTIDDLCNKKAKRSDLPCSHEEVNHTILSNKEGFYSWRPMQLIHPVIYVYIVRLITQKNNWTTIQKRFKEFYSPKINGISMPRVSNNNLSDKASLVQYWWENIEQASIKKSLEYNYLFKTDITDCYGSLYTHSIEWALDPQGKEGAKKRLGSGKPSTLGGLLDKAIRYMTYNQTNGIPQGSTLMDFVAEMVLGYADLCLSNRLTELNITKYYIIRYRDDYRIFTDDPSTGHLILKTLNEILHDLGMKLNPGKTSENSDVISSSIKSEKLERISIAPIRQNVQKETLRIYQLSKKYPNAGILSTELSKLYDDISDIEYMSDYDWNKDNEDLDSIIAVLTMTSYYSPRVINWTSAIISKILLGYYPNKDKRNEIIDHIFNKFRNIPHTGFIDIWLQRITEPFGKTFEYHDKLTKVALGKIRNIELWNSVWVKSELIDLINLATISAFSEDLKEDRISPAIQRDEVELFNIDYF